MYTNDPKQMSDTRLARFIENLKGQCFSYGMLPDTPEDFLAMLYDDMRAAEAEQETRNNRFK